MSDTNLRDIVRFNENADCRAARFCHERGITGKIIQEKLGVFAIDVGFDYLVYARPHQIDKVIERSEIPEVVE